MDAPPPPARALFRLHRVLISMGIALAVIFAIYQARGLAAGRDDSGVWLGVSVAIGTGLAVYLRWFLRKRSEG